MTVDKSSLPLDLDAGTKHSSSVGVLRVEANLQHLRKEGRQQLELDSSEEAAFDTSANQSSSHLQWDKQNQQNPECEILLEEIFTSDYNVTDEEVAEYAQRIGIHSHSDPHLLSLAKKALLTPLPSPWTPVKSKSNRVYYFNPKTGESSWTHPVDASLKDLIVQSKGGRERIATDTDSCIEDLKTEEEADSYRRKDLSVFGYESAFTSSNNSTASSKNSPKKQPVINKASATLPSTTLLGPCESKTDATGEILQLKGKENLVIGSNNHDTLDIKETAHDFPSSIEDTCSSSSSSSNSKNLQSKIVEDDIVMAKSGNSGLLPPVGSLGGGLNLRSSQLAPLRNLQPLGKPTSSTNDNLNPRFIPSSPMKSKGGDKIDLSSFPVESRSSAKSLSSLPGSSTLKPIIKSNGSYNSSKSPEKSIRWKIEKDPDIAGFHDSQEDEESKDVDVSDCDESIEIEHEKSETTFHTKPLPLTPLSKIPPNRMLVSSNPTLLSSSSDPWKDDDKKTETRKYPPKSSVTRFHQESNLKSTKTDKEILPLKSSETKPAVSSTANNATGTKAGASSAVVSKGLGPSNSPIPVTQSTTKLSGIKTSQEASQTKVIQGVNSKPTNAKPTTATPVSKSIPAASAKRSSVTTVSSASKIVPKSDVKPSTTVTKTTPAKPAVVIAEKKATPAVTAVKPKQNAPIKAAATTTQRNPITKVTTSSITKATPNEKPEPIKRSTIPNQNLELEEGTNPKKCTSRMEKVSSILANKNSSPRHIEDQFERKDETGDRETRKENDCICRKYAEAALRDSQKEEIIDNFIQKLARSGSDDHFLKRLKEEAASQEELDTTLKRKRELTLMSATLEIERNMNIVLKERQLELKKEHMTGINQLKEYYDKDLENVKKEAEQREAHERHQQSFRLNHLQDQYRQEAEILQLSHREQLDNMKKQNEKDIDEMKRELRRYLMIHKEEWEAKLEEMKLVNEIERVNNIRPNSGSMLNHNHPATSGVSQDKNSYSADETLRKELKELRAEVEAMKEARSQTSEDATDNAGSSLKIHKCKYGSKYKDIRKKHSKLIQKINEEKKKSFSKVPNTDTSSSETTSSSLVPPNPRKPPKAKKRLRFASNVSSFDDSELDMNISDNGGRVKNLDFLLSSTPKKLSGSDRKLYLPPDVSMINHSYDDDNDSDWLTLESSRILEETEKFLKVSNNLDDGYDLNVNNFEEELYNMVKDQKGLSALDGNEDIDLVPDDIMAILNQGKELQSELENSYPDSENEINSSNRSELDLILDKFKKNNVATYDATNYSQEHLSDKLSFENLPTENFTDFMSSLNLRRIEENKDPSNDINSFNKYLRTRWQSIFGASGNFGWPTREMRSSILESNPAIHGDTFLVTNNLPSPMQSDLNTKIQGIRTWLNQSQELSKNIMDETNPSTNS